MTEQKIPDFLQKGRKVHVDVTAGNADPSAWERGKNGVWEVDKTYFSTRPLDEGALFVVLKSVGRKHQAYINIPFDAAAIKPFEDINAADMASGQKISTLRPVSFKPPKP